MAAGEERHVRDDSLIRDDNDLGGEGYGAFIEATRALMDAVVYAAPPPNAMSSLTGDMSALTDRIARWGVSEQGRWAGRRGDLPGHGHPMHVPLVIDSLTAQELRGTVVLRPFYVGGNLAAHGGTQPLLFDDVLGRLANAGSRAMARTAQLTVNYRSVAPLGVRLQVLAKADRVEGRKHWMSGLLLDGDRNLIADAVGLFLELRPEQA